MAIGYDTARPTPTTSINDKVIDFESSVSLGTIIIVPLFMLYRLPENDADALSSMLMSWYISGFHTGKFIRLGIGVCCDCLIIMSMIAGYYHGIKQAKENQEKRKK